MSSDHQLDDALRALARQGGQGGPIPAVTDIRRRGDTRRRRRRTGSVALAAVAVVALGTGVALARLGEPAQPTPVGPPGPVIESPVVTDPSVDPSAGPSVPPSSPPVVPPNNDRLLSGKRQVTIVRTGAFEAGLSLLDDGRLAEVDGDEGRQLFVFTPSGPDTYQIRTAEPGTDLTDTCWEVRSSGSQPLRVEAAPCAQDEPRQQFTVVRDGEATYAISSHSAYLQESRTWGLILEEAGDAPATTWFRLVDNGPAPE
ncbi:hypothetical protein E0H26_00260 [Micromonospora zingiberis]|uniref:Uncharacterized protein n=1 Tax=Micromonospora zingiberis TaxID=2053011 RepID=A0A4R0GSZ5_9ACTN|nr:RICIN domain-containing protein [Micromonospora zingiberis]TCC00178.1 hypothetical protein E0H26_00260 [Micromonospora zingiberis]